jgi:hypothetical protein
MLSYFGYPDADKAEYVTDGKILDVINKEPDEVSPDEIEFVLSSLCQKNKESSSFLGHYLGWGKNTDDVKDELVAAEYKKLKTFVQRHGLHTGVGSYRDICAYVDALINGCCPTDKPCTIRERRVCCSGITEKNVRCKNQGTHELFLDAFMDRTKKRIQGKTILQYTLQKER